MEGVHGTWATYHLLLPPATHLLLALLGGYSRTLLTHTTHAHYARRLLTHTTHALRTQTTHQQRQVFLTQGIVPLETHGALDLLLACGVE